MFAQVTIWTETVKDVTLNITYITNINIIAKQVFQLKIICMYNFHFNIWNYTIYKYSSKWFN